MRYAVMLGVMLGVLSLPAYARDIAVRGTSENRAGDVLQQLRSLSPAERNRLLRENNVGALARTTRQPNGAAADGTNAGTNAGAASMGSVPNSAALPPQNMLRDDGSARPIVPDLGAARSGRNITDSVQSPIAPAQPQMGGAGLRQAAPPPPAPILPPTAGAEAARETMSGMAGSDMGGARAAAGNVWRPIPKPGETEAAPGVANILSAPSAINRSLNQPSGGGNVWRSTPKPGEEQRAPRPATITAIPRGAGGGGGVAAPTPRPVTPVAPSWQPAPIPSPMPAPMPVPAPSPNNGGGLDLPWM